GDIPVVHRLLVGILLQHHLTGIQEGHTSGRPGLWRGVRMAIPLTTVYTRAGAIELRLFPVSLDIHRDPGVDSVPRRQPFRSPETLIEDTLCDLLIVEGSTFLLKHPAHSLKDPHPIISRTIPRISASRFLISASISASGRGGV